MSVQYSFPLLKYKEIRDCLRDLQIPLTMDELKDPKDERMRTVYETFVTVLTGVSRDAMRTPDFEAIDALTYPELHERSVAEVGMNKAILKLLRRVGVSDASLKDIIAPQTARTKRILSALINFAKFREERLTTYQEFTQKTDEMVALRQELERDHDQLNLQLDDLKCQREEDAPQIEALEQEIKEMANGIREQNREQNELRDHIGKAKEQVAELTEEEKANAARIDELTAECDQMRAQIVRSPDRLKNSLTQMTNAIAKYKDEAATLTASHTVVQKRGETLDYLARKLEHRLAQVDACEEEVRKAKTVQKQVKETMHDIAAVQEQVARHQSEEAEMTRRLEAGQAKLFGLQGMFEEKRLAAAAALAQVQAQKLALTRSANKDKVQLEQNESALATARQRMQVMQEEHENVRAQLRAKLTGLAAQVAKFHADMRPAMAGQTAEQAAKLAASTSNTLSNKNSNNSSVNHHSSIDKENQQQQHHNTQNRTSSLTLNAKPTKASALRTDLLMNNANGNSNTSNNGGAHQRSKTMSSLLM